MKITPTSLTISQLLGSNNEQYVIPSYQRRYSWHDRQVREFINDIRLIESEDTHLLGSIVCLTSHYKAGLNRLELVDGQQRLTTTAIVLECLRQYLLSAGEADESADVARLLASKPLGGAPQSKIAMDSIDAACFEQLVESGQSQTTENPRLNRAFEIVREWVSGESLDSLSGFLYRLKNQAIVVRLDVSDAKDAFKLFETINNRGLRLSATDIVKNFLLGNAARFGESALKNARSCWTNLIRHLDGTNPDTFFRYYLMTFLHARITASQVVPSFKQLFMSRVAEAYDLPDRHLYTEKQSGDDLDDEETEVGDESEEVVEELPETARILFSNFLMDLADSARVFGELVLVKTTDKVINRHLRNLRMIKSAQTYGYLMHLRTRGCSDKDFRSILKLTESFVLRRHICRERSNETEALFAKLCSVDPLDPVESTRSAYRELSPSDEKFREEFELANFPARLIDRARYCLEQIELSKYGEHEELQVLGAEDVHVEHIVPKKIKTKKAKRVYGDWVTYLGVNSVDRHREYVSRIGNLTIFAGPLNIGASNNPFQKKKTAYKQSGIKITQELTKWPKFRFTEIAQRSKELSETAIALWPLP